MGILRRWYWLQYEGGFAVSSEQPMRHVLEYELTKAALGQKTDTEPTQDAIEV